MSSHAAAAPAPRWREVLEDGRWRLTVGLVLLESGLAVEALIVVTIMPAAARELQGLPLYGWVFSAYGLASLISIPLAGRSADRRGLARPLALMLGVFAGGSLLCGLAPSMLVLVAGRFMQGYGAGAQYALGWGTVAKAYPEALRARLLVIMSAAWALPALLGPPLGGLLAATVGWRWAFFFIFPLVGLAAALLLPPLSRQLVTASSEVDPLRLRWPLMLAVGVGALLLALSGGLAAAPLAAAAGLALAWAAIRRVLPAGSLTAQPGLPAAVAASLLSTMALFGAEAFVPLYLTHVRGRSITEASLAVTCGALAWVVGTWWQARVVERVSIAHLVALGSAMIALACLGLETSLLGGPLALPYAAWALGGAGMGIVYPTLGIAAMRWGGPGREGTATAAIQLSSVLGVALGAGLGGAAIAMAYVRGAPLSAALAVAFGMCVVAALATVALSTRLRPTAA